MRPGRPVRLAGVAYDRAGVAYHCRLGTWDRQSLFALPDTASLIVEAIRGAHERSIVAEAFCVMPDHLHLLLRFRREGLALGRWIGDFKRWTIRLAHSQGLGPLRWQPGFYEHIVRSSEEELNIARYILANPVRAGLVEQWQSYRWSGSSIWQR